MREREQASFWRENVIAVVILLRGLVRVATFQWQKQMLEVLSLCDRERAVTSFNKDDSTFLVNQKYHEAFQGVYILKKKKKTVVKSRTGSRFRPRI